jgi:enamine deaminase RidA (YjgF/YER057c/UK114 family)
MSKLVSIFLIASLTAAAASAAPAFKSFGDSSGRYSPVNVSAATAPLYFPSGATAGQDAPADMKSQAAATLAKLTENVVEAGLTLEDVAFARAYLAPGADGKVDYEGWNAAWDEVFNNPAKPAKGKPARTTVAVPLLGRPATLIEIEFICFPRAGKAMFSSAAKAALPVFNSQLKPYGAKEGRILAGVGVLPGSALYWTQGSTAPVLDAKLPPTDAGHRGDMRTQARNTLLALQKNLANVGLTFKDVIYLRAFLGPDVHLDGKFDYDGWNASYGEFFNTAENPHKPARTTVTTPTYGNPSTLIEIELIAAFPQPPKLFDAKAANPRIKAYGEPTAMISSGVAVAANSPLVVTAGVVSAVPGDVKAQALSALDTLQKRLAVAGLSFKDVVFLRAYIVPEKDGSVDRAGWTEAYTQYFNNPQQPHKPARTTIAVLSLPRPDLKIEIDVIAVIPK